MADTRAHIIDPDVAAYVVAHSSPPDDVQRRLMEVTVARTGRAAGMQIGNDQGTFLEVLARASGARLAVEIGTFTGFSALSIARGLGPAGRLICCDVSEEWTAIGREHWEQAGVADRIDLRIGPAVDTLAALPADLTVDLAFIDADKVSYLTYYEALLPRMAPDGVILVDNTLWSRRVLDPAVDDADTVALRAFNDAVAADTRVRVVMVPMGDGVTLIQPAR
jgi:caffeoyl-CoA O-methyltransferase